MIEGKTVPLGGREFIIPPAPFAAMRKHSAVFNGQKAPDLLDMGDIVYSAIARNYPDLAQQEFEEKYMDIGNIKTAFNAAMSISGAEPVPGEAVPGNP